MLIRVNRSRVGPGDPVFVRRVLVEHEAELLTLKLSEFGIASWIEKERAIGGLSEIGYISDTHAVYVRRRDAAKAVRILAVEAGRTPR